MLYDMLTATTAQYPQKTAIETDNLKINYIYLKDQIDQFASELHLLGLEAGNTAVLLLPNSIEFIVAVFAITKLGGVVVPLNTALESTELRFYLADSQPSVLISTDDLVSQQASVIQENTHNCHIITRVLTSGKTSALSSQITYPFIVPEAIALYQYSSGSTGKPKRVMRSHANLIHEAHNFKSTVNVSPSDRILCAIPMFHAHGFGNCLLATVCSGATLLILKKFNRDGVMDMLTNQQITLFPGVPFMFSILADSTSISSIELPNLRLAFTAGAPLSQPVFQKFLDRFGVSLRQLYGSTETGSIAINLDETTDELWASVGKPLNGVDIRIVDEGGNTLKAGETGEIVVCSAAMTQGYAGLEEANREVFRGGCFWSGDLGRQDINGNVFISGRKKLFINVGANKVDPGEVEAVLNTHPAIKECVVLGIPSVYGDEVVKAVLVLNYELDTDTVKTWLRGKIADFKIPRVVEFRQEIPRSPLGKILRKHLQDQVS